MSGATVTTKGQVTIPAEIRDQFEIEAGDQLMFYPGPGGRLVVRIRRPRVGAGRGILPSKGRPITREGIGDAVAEGVAARRGERWPTRKHRRGKRG